MEDLFKLVVIAGLVIAIIQLWRIKKMGEKTDAAITALEGNVQQLGESLLKEIQQLKDAKAAGADDQAAIDRITAAAQNIASFKAQLDADDGA